MVASPGFDDLARVRARVDQAIAQDCDLVVLKRMAIPTRRAPTVLDLFSGCSGLGLGAAKAGLRVVASIDHDAILTSSHEANFPGSSPILADIASLSGVGLRNRLGVSIDGIIGGPPCQGFSEIGRAAPDDPRKYLLDHFFRLVDELRPRFFLMENVRGLLFEKNRPFLDRALGRVAASYRIVGPFHIDASDYGAATRRPRVFVIGYDAKHFEPLSLEHVRAAQRPAATVRDAIEDLGEASEVGSDDAGFDFWRHARTGEISNYARRLRERRALFTGHRRTPHLPSVSSRFSTVAPGGIDVIGRHPRLAWDGQCPTIRAGTGPDRGSFQAVRPLHPTEHRVITTREAARLQGFPDWFRFHPTIWHSFRMIGNSVSPILAEHIFSLIRSRFSSAASAAVAAE